MLKVHGRVGVKHKTYDHQHRYHNGAPRGRIHVRTLRTDIEKDASMAMENALYWFESGFSAGMVMVFQSRNLRDALWRNMSDRALDLSRYSHHPV
jgi:hypothetical protein